MTATTPGRETGKDLVRRFWEDVFNQGDAGAVAEVVSTRYELRDLSTGAELDREDLTKLVEGLRENLGMPEAEVVDQWQAEGDRVVTRLVFRARPVDAKDDYGDPVEINAVTVDQVVDSQVESTIVMWDAWTADSKLRPRNSEILEWRFPWW